jgi:aminopeptidase N
MEEIYLVAGPYVLREAEHEGVAVMTYTYENTEEGIAQRYIDGTRRYLDLYGERIGPYPFPKFAMIENFWQTGYGMPSFTLLGDRVIRLPWILDTSYGHEILHNWWGNGVFVDFASGNWCEGLTVYGADYYYKEQEGAAQARDYRRTALQAYLDYVSGSEDTPLRLFRERHDFATQAIGYSKSMMVIHQVRRLLGEKRFMHATQEFYRKHLFRWASWDDLFAAFSEQAGRDLYGWKEQWVDRTGAPSLVLKEHRVARSAGDGFVAEVTVAQEQSDLYDLLVPVCVGWDDPPAESTKVVVLSDAEATASFRVPQRPDWIAVDPHYDVLRRIDAAEIPPALSRTLGADTALVIIASGLDSEMTAAYESLALDWEEGAMLGIFYEKDVDAAQMPDLPIWFFGRGPMARDHIEQLDAGWEDALGELPAEAGIVLAGGPPDRPQNAWSLVEASGVEQIADLGRKIPHYGKYSYLVFDGAQNVAKGSWDVVSSPLRVSLAD